MLRQADEHFKVVMPAFHIVEPIRLSFPNDQQGFLSVVGLGNNLHVLSEFK